MMNNNENNVPEEGKEIIEKLDIKAPGEAVTEEEKAQESLPAEVHEPEAPQTDLIREVISTAQKVEPILFEKDYDPRVIPQNQAELSSEPHGEKTNIPTQLPMPKSDKMEGRTFPEFKAAEEAREPYDEAKINKLHLKRPTPYGMYESVISDPDSDTMWGKADRNGGRRLDSLQQFIAWKAHRDAQVFHTYGHEIDQNEYQIDVLGKLYIDVMYRLGKEQFNVLAGVELDPSKPSQSEEFQIGWLNEQLSNPQFRRYMQTPEAMKEIQDGMRVLNFAERWNGFENIPHPIASKLPMPEGNGMLPAKYVGMSDEEFSELSTTRLVMLNMEEAFLATPSRRLYGAIPDGVREAFGMPDISGLEFGTERTPIGAVVGEIVPYLYGGYVAKALLSGIPALASRPLALDVASGALVDFAITEGIDDTMLAFMGKIQEEGSPEGTLAAELYGIEDDEEFEASMIAAFESGAIDLGSAAFMMVVKGAGTGKVGRFAKLADRMGNTKLFRKFRQSWERTRKFTSDRVPNKILDRRPFYLDEGHAERMLGKSDEEIAAWKASLEAADGEKKRAYHRLLGAREMWRRNPTSKEYEAAYISAYQDYLSASLEPGSKLKETLDNIPSVASGDESVPHLTPSDQRWGNKAIEDMTEKELQEALDEVARKLKLQEGESLKEATGRTHAEALNKKGDADAEYAQAREDFNNFRSTEPGRSKEEIEKELAGHSETTIKNPAWYKKQKELENELAERIEWDKEATRLANKGRRAEQKVQRAEEELEASMELLANKDKYRLMGEELEAIAGGRRVAEPHAPHKMESRQEAEEWLRINRANNRVGVNEIEDIFVKANLEGDGGIPKLDEVINNRKTKLQRPLQTALGATLDAGVMSTLAGAGLAKVSLFGGTLVKGLKKASDFLGRIYMTSSARAARKAHNRGKDIAKVGAARAVLRAGIRDIDAEIKRINAIEDPSMEQLDQALALESKKKQLSKELKELSFDAKASTSRFALHNFFYTLSGGTLPENPTFMDYFAALIRGAGDVTNQRVPRKGDPRISSKSDVIMGADIPTGEVDKASLSRLGTLIDGIDNPVLRNLLKGATHVQNLFSARLPAAIDELLNSGEIISETTGRFRMSIESLVERSEPLKKLFEAGGEGMGERMLDKMTLLFSEYIADAMSSGRAFNADAAANYVMKEIAGDRELLRVFVGIGEETGDTHLLTTIFADIFAPVKGMAEDAYREGTQYARKTTLSMELEGGLEDGVRAWQTYKTTRMIQPFARNRVNSLAVALEYTPFFGAIPLLLKRMKNAPIDVQRRIGSQIVGMLGLTGYGFLYSSGRVKVDESRGYQVLEIRGEPIGAEDRDEIIGELLNEDLDTIKLHVQDYNRINGTNLTPRQYLEQTVPKAGEGYTFQVDRMTPLGETLLLGYHMFRVAGWRGDVSEEELIRGDGFLDYLGEAAFDVATYLNPLSGFVRGMGNEKNFTRTFVLDALHRPLNPAMAKSAGEPFAPEVGMDYTEEDWLRRIPVLARLFDVPYMPQRDEFGNVELSKDRILGTVDYDVDAYEYRWVAHELGLRFQSPRATEVPGFGSIDLRGFTLDKSKLDEETTKRLKRLGIYDAAHAYEAFRILVGTSPLPHGEGQTSIGLINTYLKSPEYRRDRELVDEWRKPKRKHSIEETREAEAALKRIEDFYREVALGPGRQTASMVLGSLGGLWVNEDDISLEQQKVNAQLAEAKRKAAHEKLPPTERKAEDLFDALGGNK